MGSRNQEWTGSTHNDCTLVDTRERAIKYQDIKIKNKKKQTHCFYFRKFSERFTHSRAQYSRQYHRKDWESVVSLFSLEWSLLRTVPPNAEVFLQRL